MDGRSFTTGVVGFYLLLATAAWGWVALRGLPWTRLLSPGTPVGLAIEAAVGLGFGLLVVWLGNVLERRVGVLKDLSRTLRDMLPRVGEREIAVAAVASSVGEELFFRGAMQSALGLWITAAVFAVAHGGFMPGLRAWMVFAGLMGIAFGAMVVWLGTLTAPIVAHATINWLNLRSMNRAAQGGEP